MTNIIDNFNDSVKKLMSIFDKNKYFGAGLTLFLILYSAVAAPKLPLSVLKIFDNIFVKLLIFFLIAYIAQKDVVVAIVASVGLMVTLILLNKLEMNNMMIDIINREEMYTNVSKDVKNNAEDKYTCPYIFDPDNMEVKIDNDSHFPEDIIKDFVNGSVENSSCYEKADYRDNFYHQFLDAKPENSKRYNDPSVESQRFSSENIGTFDCNL